MYFPDIERKKIRLSLKVSRRSCQNCSPCVRENILGGNTFLRQNSLFSLIFWHWAEKVSSFGKTFQLSWKNCFFECLLNFLRKILKLKYSFSNRFRTWARIFRIFDKNIFAGWSKLHFTRPQAHNEEKNVEKLSLFFHFFRGSIKVLALWQKFFDRVVESAV